MSPSASRSLLPVAASLLWFAVGAPLVADDGDLAGKLAAADEVYRVSMRASGRKVSTFAEGERKTVDWRYTAADGRRAIEQIPARPLSETGTIGVSKGVFLFDKDLSGECYTSSVLRGGAFVSPNMADGSHSIEQSAPDDPKNSCYELILLLTMGRGYARYVTSIDGIEPDESDSGARALRVHGAGRCLSPRPGRWNLLVVPGESHLVREASFTVDGESTPRFRVTNRGRLREGDCEVAEEGRFTLMMPSPNDVVTYDVTVRSASLAADEELLESVRDLVVDSLPPHSFVEDRRLDPPRLYQIDRNGRAVGDSARSD